MNLIQFIKSTPKKENYYSHIRPAIICKDGFRMSVQASEYHYSTPRLFNCETYSEFEIGFPSEFEQSIMEYAEEYNNPTKTVYGYVPARLVHDIIEKHGGIDVEKTFSNAQSKA